MYRQAQTTITIAYVLVPNRHQDNNNYHPGLITKFSLKKMHLKASTEKKRRSFISSREKSTLDDLLHSHPSLHRLIVLGQNEWRFVSATKNLGPITQSAQINLLNRKISSTPMASIELTQHFFSLYVIQLLVMLFVYGINFTTFFIKISARFRGYFGISNVIIFFRLLFLRVFSNQSINQSINLSRMQGPKPFWDSMHK